MGNLLKLAKYYSRCPLKYIKFNNNNKKESNNNNILIRAIPSKKAKIIPSKNKGKEYNTNIKLLETTIEVIILIVIELSIYYKEAYYIRYYILILANNLLVNIRQFI
jgi:hypothetical protein